MKQKIVIFILLLCLSSIAIAASKDLKKAMKAYEKRDYLEASTLLLSNMDSLKGKENDIANLYMGIINTKNAEFHKALHQVSLESNEVYLKELAKAKGKKRSKYVSLFLGEVYLNKGKYKSAIKQFDKFLKEKKTDKQLKHLAYVQMGLAKYMQKKTKSANAYWSKVKKPDFSTNLALVAAKEKVGAKAKYNVNELYSSFTKSMDSKDGVSGRDISNMISVLTKHDMYKEGLAVLTSQYVDSPSHRESFKADKQISFYDIQLLENSYKFYKQLGNKYLSISAKSNKYGPTAALYLMDSGIIFSDKKQLDLATNVLSKGDSLPKALKKLKPAKLNAGDYVVGNKKKANNAREQIISSNKRDPSVYSEVLTLCVYTMADCNNIVKEAKNLSAVVQGRKYAPLNKGIGHYLLHKNEPSEALTYLELARDKSNKNKLSANDPILLVNLADSYRRDNVYLETLEIFFEMNRYYPVVRQIQEAVQGTYAMHQKSAGDVKIF